MKTFEITHKDGSKSYATEGIILLKNGESEKEQKTKEKEVNIEKIFKPKKK